MTWEPVSTFLSAICGFGAWWWIWLLGDAARHRREFVRLVEVATQVEPPGGWPTVALIFAARDEAASVETATRSMLALDYPRLRIVAVDDRSTDGTGPILDRLAASDDRLQVVHVEQLPPEWLGKTHALQIGAAAVADWADWLLLTDADIHFAPDTIRQGVALAVRDQLDLLAAVPGVVTESFGERAFMGFFSLLFALGAAPWRVADPKGKTAVGIGAFNLVRATTFRDVGGFSHIALSVDDDMRLGQAIKFAGHRCGVVIGVRALSVRWHVGIAGMVRGLEKNFFGAMDYRLALVPVSLSMLTLLGILPFVGLFLGPWWMRLFCGLGIASVACLYGLSQGSNGLAWYHAFGMPLAAGALITALLRSTYLTLARGGVRWRGHLYPLPLLRAHCRRRNEWLRELWLSTR